MTRPERRRAPRVGCVLPVQLYAHDDPKVIETLTKDLSTSGLRCLSPVVKGAASPVSLEMTLGQGERPLSLRAKIVWFERVPHGNQFYLGLAFQNLSDQDTRRLSRYLERLASKP
ncbi:MAG: PilZ domain-containing protein [Candidatus Omnitrophica bacterium]|nr:PilZ domain-containing protein [Candidatus Omnitrophota bacterium]